MLTLADRMIWLVPALCLSLSALLVAGCGSEEPAAEAPEVSQTSPTAAPAAPTEAPEPTAVVVPTSPPAEAAVETGHRVGQMAPGFMLTTVDGEEVSLEGFQGQPLVIYFYTTW